MKSLTLSLSPAARVRLPVAHGQMVHAWFLDFIKQRDPALAQALHDDESEKPFTLSMLNGVRRVKGNAVMIAPGETPTVRLTAIDEAIETMLHEVALVPSVTLHHHELSIVSRKSDSCSFEELARQRREPARKFAVRFASPTAFRSGRENLPLPVPETVVSRLASKWNRYAPDSLLIDQPHVVATAVWLSRCSIRTDYLAFEEGDNRYGQVGFAGICEFMVDDRAAPDVARVVEALFRFAYFAGVGYKTTMGMGQALPAQWPTGRSRSGFHPS